MMTKKTMLIFLGVSLAMLSCKKEQSNLNPVMLHEPDPASLSAFFHNNVDNTTQYFQVDVAQLSTIEGEKGVSVTFYPNTLMDANGNDVEGLVDVSLVEVLTKKDMILKNKPTLSYHYGEYRPLVSDGEFYLSVTQQNAPVFLKQYQDVKVVIPRTADLSINSIPRFIGNNDSDSLIWSLDADSSAFFIPESSNKWKTYLNVFGWINCDYFYDDPRPKTIVEAELPPGYDNATCKVFISFDGLNSLTQFFNYNEPVLSIAPNYELPIGLDVHFIAINVINDVLYCEIIPDVLEENHRVQITNLEMVTENELETLLDALP